MTKKRTQKPYQEMNADELAEATAEFDNEFVADSFGPLTPEMRAQWEAAKRRPDRPRSGQGLQLISVTIEKELLARADALAKRKKISRSRLVARGLKAVLAAEGEI